MRARTIASIFATLCLLALPQGFALAAEDVFYDVAVGDLKLTEGELPKPADQIPGVYRQWIKAPAMSPRAVVEGDGEAYLSGADVFIFRTQETPASTYRLLIRAPKGKDVAGRLFLPKSDWSGMQPLKFIVPAAQAKDTAKETFYRTKLAQFDALQQQGNPGAAWFRHEADEARKALKIPADQGAALQPGGRPRRGEFGEVDDTYALFSGGRAVSENLQLDRAPRASGTDTPTVDINTLEGITVAEIDWKPLVKDLNPKLDALAALIPADQHVVLFPNFKSAVTLADEANGRATSMLQLGVARSEDVGVQARYERQLGLSLTGLGRVLGPKLVGGMAITGSDPYFPSGTDVAVLFEAEKPAVLKALLIAQMQLSAKDQADAKPQTGEVKGIPYSGLRTPDRRICGYVAELKGAVVVTNSLAQLERLANVGKDSSPSIASLDEFKFFRDRYKLGAEDETALIFLSDATIRRWCSPRWRIASARRTRTAAVLAELQAENFAALASGKAKIGPLQTDLAMINGGELSLAERGVASSTQGTLAWMTPIIELPIEKVSKSEADAYTQWRNGYQGNWRWAFDPIALRLGVKADKLAADLTVMPLIAGTEYREFIEIAQGVKIAPDAGDKHDAIAHFILAVDTKSPRMQGWGNFASTLAPNVRIDPLGWLGKSVSLYVDYDPLWAELAKLPPEKRLEFDPHIVGRLPIALQAEVSNPFKLTAFLAAFRAFIEQTAPGMVTWESKTYRDQAYVQMKPTAQSRQMIGGEMALYYAPSADGLTLTLSEPLIKRVIDRRVDRAATKEKVSNDKAEKNPQPETASLPWLGSSLCLQAERRVLELLAAAQGDEYQATMQIRSWSNLPILNVWKRMFPDQDPVKLHERLWYSRLICPGGGEYVWNPEWQTMESTVYGHPGQPKAGPAAPAVLSDFRTANFGLTFEEQGLRTRLELMRNAK